MESKLIIHTEVDWGSLHNDRLCVVYNIKKNSQGANQNKLVRKSIAVSVVCTIIISKDMEIFALRSTPNGLFSKIRQIFNFT